MKLLDLTLESPESNLALDEALLDEAESSPDGAEWLRLWEPQKQMVVLGRASQAGREVHLDRCQQTQVPVLRRCSGGAAIVTGPGCLMYSLVLGLEDRPQLRFPEHAHQFVLGQITRALESLGPGIALEGTSDLAIEGHKFSGNSLRCKRNHILYHGTLLYDFPLEQISALLQMPPRQPDYRQERDHCDFVTNLEIGAGPLRQLLVAQWQATGDGADWPRERTGHLVATRYGKEEWNQ
ncbi:MAG: lipoate--protein ligase family protein [Pirellulaceae bacterium]|nr:lipoate--protein ligase family protein [Pirellulaceae bacterium]